MTELKDSEQLKKRIKIKDGAATQDLTRIIPQTNVAMALASARMIRELKLDDVPPSCDTEIWGKTGLDARLTSLVNYGYMTKAFASDIGKQITEHMREHEQWRKYRAVTWLKARGRSREDLSISFMVFVLIYDIRYYRGRRGVKRRRGDQGRDFLLLSQVLNEQEIYRGGNALSAEALEKRWKKIDMEHAVKIVLATLMIMEKKHVIIAYHVLPDGFLWRVRDRFHNYLNKDKKEPLDSLVVNIKDRLLKLLPT